MQKEQTPKNYLFFKWYLQWQKDNVDTMLIYFQVPNVVHPIAPIAMAGNDAILLLHVDLRGAEFNAHHEEQLEFLINGAKDFAVDIYVHKKVLEQYPQAFELMPYERDNYYLISKHS